MTIFILTFWLVFRYTYKHAGEIILPQTLTERKQKMSKENAEKVFASQDEIMAAYKSIFNALMTKEKTQTKSKTVFERSEALQEVILTILEKKPEIEAGKEYHYIRRAIRNVMFEKYEHERLTEIFSGRLDSDRTDIGILVELEAEKGYGLTKQYISDIFRDIQSTLTVDEFEIWKCYTLDDMTGKQIADQIGETEVSACRKIKRIFNKIEELHIACLVDERYNALVTKKRIQTYYPPATGKNSEPVPVSASDHITPVKTPSKPLKTYDNPQAVFLKKDNTDHPAKARPARITVNAERAYILKTWAEYWKMQTAGIVARPEMDYIGPADKMTTFRVGNALMMSN
jgi:hypothetical protein